MVCFLPYGYCVGSSWGFSGLRFPPDTRVPPVPEAALMHGLKPQGLRRSGGLSWAAVLKTKLTVFHCVKGWASINKHVHHNES